LPPASAYEAYAAAAHKAATIEDLEDGPDAAGGMFTDDARQGMRALERYWDFVRDVALPLEQTLPECASGACTANRRLLEQAWQVVSNEYYEAAGRSAGAAPPLLSAASLSSSSSLALGGGGGSGGNGSGGGNGVRPHFSQAWWAGQLLPALSLDGVSAAAPSPPSPSFSSSPSSTDSAAAIAAPRPPRGVLATRRDAEGALRWMVASLGDRYTAYLPPPAWGAALRRPVPPNARRYLEAQSVGVGLALGPVGPRGAGRVVESPMAGSAAEEAGVLRGDLVLALDGVPAERLSPADAARVLRGPSGSSVSVALAPRSPAGAARELVIERRPIPQPAVREARLPLPPRPPPPPPGASSSSSLASSSSSPAAAAGGYYLSSASRRPPPREALYLRVSYFSHATTKALAAALSAAAADPSVAGVVLDLRNDPGGVFEEAIADAAMLMGDADAPVAATVRSPAGGVDAVWRGSSLPGEIFTPAAARAAALVGSWSPSGGRAGGVPPLAERPVAVLLNRSSASASELLAVALRDNARSAAAARQRWEQQQLVGAAAAGRLGSSSISGSGSEPAEAPPVVPRVALIGEQTFGKGVVQFFFPLGDEAGRSGGALPARVRAAAGSPREAFPPSSPLVASGGGLRVTVAKYLGPRGTDVGADGGLAPDLRCGDYPHGVFSARGGTADACVVQAMNFINRGGQPGL